MIVQAIVMCIAGALIGFIGYLIRFKGMVHLLAGYDERKVKDHNGLQRFAGNGVLALGAIPIAGGLLLAITAGWESVAQVVIWITWGVFLLAVAVLIVGAQRFTK